ncbi:hypothetical protein [Amycolatopsis sp. Hca4]|uniref:hypothetical protein n=1 Tax=Amycolatopsis sp. Hca4 TaxID=2742131 RepID=UPI001590E6C1|nr:hypothetical protein [Amycolatopsis sp. Hca4]QKV73919.1 hypothetical protein HUT10_09155 [Amycolatopsis sp. Hca4]
MAFGTAESVPDDVAKDLFTVNVLAPVALLRSAAPLRVLRRRSHVSGSTSNTFGYRCHRR